ncbi:MAG: hypothetical protein ACRDZ5_02920, partial [Acidimicrobiales bacterium]
MPASFGVGLVVYHLKDAAAKIINPVTGDTTSGRVLTTEVRYPSLGGTGTGPATSAPPASAYGPFPVVVFAGGFETMPET